MLFELDHILWASSDLATGERLFVDATGVKPAFGGSHAGVGTRNSLASLGRGTYFEIISVDPDQKDSKERAAEVGAILRPRLLTFAVRGSTLDDFYRVAAELGLQPTEPFSMSRTRSDGVILSWKLVYLNNPEFRNCVPFAIDWENSEHPSRTTPKGCEVKEFCALHPDPERIGDIYTRLGIDVAVKRAPVAGFQAVFSTPKGDVTLT